MTRLRAAAAVPVAIPVIAAALIASGCAGEGGQPRAAGGSGSKQAAARPDLKPGPATWSGPRLTGQAARSAAVPILMYHVMTAAKPGVAYPGLWVSREAFADQVATLKRAGFQAVTLGQLWSAWHGSAPLPAKPIVLTFDDGYLSDGTNAAPILRSAGWPGVLNLELRNVGPKGIPEGMVKGMIAHGWEVDSHTIDHPDMTTLSPEAMRAQLVGSRDRIEQQFGVRPWFFCYPAGRYDEAVEQQVRDAGYLGATTELPGWAKPGGNPYELPRIRVTGDDTGASLLAKVLAAGPA